MDLSLQQGRYIQTFQDTRRGGKREGEREREKAKEREREEMKIVYEFL